MGDQTAGEIILVVEDHPANLRLTTIILERDGFHVMQARSADEAKQQLQQVTPHLILVDVGLPGQNGLSLTRELKGNVATAGIPIIALTARAMHADQEEALAAGCAEYISKPFNTRQLASIVRDVIANSSVEPRDSSEAL